MARRIGMWALAGAVVAFFWVLFFLWHNWSAYHGGPPFNYSAVTMALAAISVPFALFGIHHHFAISGYSSLLLNAASYACIGFVVEGFRLAFRSRLAQVRH